MFRHYRVIIYKLIVIVILLVILQNNKNARYSACSKMHGTVHAVKFTVQCMQ